MAIAAGEVFIPVRPDLAGFQSQVSAGVNTAATQATAGLGGFLKKSFSGIGAQAAAGFAGGFIALQAISVIKNFVSDSINAARDLQESMNKVDVVFDESAEGIKAWAETSAEALGISEQAALEAAGTFGNLFSAIGIINEIGAEMSTTLVDLAADLASFNNASPEDVLIALRSGLVGEVEPLRKFGVSLSAVRVQEEALRLGLAQQGDVLSAAAKAQAAYAIILADTGLAQGDFARTSEDLANSQRIAAAESENAKAALGEALLPVVTELTHAFTDLVTVVGDVGATVGPVVEGLTAPIKLLVKANTLLAEGWGKLFGLAGNLADEVAIKVTPAMQNLVEQGLKEWQLNQAELNRTVEAATPALQQFFGTFEVGPIEQVTAATDAQVASLRQLRSAQLALVDPVFAVVEAFRADADAAAELASARRTVQRLEEAGRTGSLAYADAVRTLEDATLDAVQSQASLFGSVRELSEAVEDGTTTQKAAKDALRDMAAAAGLTKDETRKLVDELNDAIAANREWNRTPLVSKTATVAIQAIVSGLGQLEVNPRLQSGGIVRRRPGGVNVTVAEGRYDEAIVPLGPGVGGGGGLSREEIEDAFVRALERVPPMIVPVPVVFTDDFNARVIAAQADAEQFWGVR